MKKFINFVNIIGRGGPEIYSNALAGCIDKYIKDDSVMMINAEIPQRNTKGYFKAIDYFKKTFLFIKTVNKNYKSGPLHLPSQELGRYVRYLNYKSLLLTVHDIISPEFCQPISKITNFMRKLDIEAIKTADHIITPSEYTKKDLIRELSISDKKISVIYYGVDHNIFYPQKDKPDIPHNLIFDKPYILYVGSEQPRKNVKTLIEIFYKIKMEYKFENIALVIVGKPGVYRENTLAQIQKLGLLKDVIFLEDVPKDRLVGVYSFSKVFVFPSLYEGFGFPVLEAMCCGTPVIASNASSIPEVVGSAGILLDPLDIEGFAKAIINLLIDEDERQKFIARGLIQAKRFDWEKTFQETVNIYKKFV